MTVARFALMDQKNFDRGRALAQELVTAFVLGDRDAVEAITDDLEAAPESQIAVINALSLMMKGAVEILAVAYDTPQPVDVLPRFFPIFEESMERWGFIPPREEGGEPDGGA